MPAPKDLPWWQDLLQLASALTKPDIVIELAALGICIVLAWAIVRSIRPIFHQNDARSILFGRRVIDGALFPALLLALAYGARALVSEWGSTALFKVALPVFISLVVIRIGVKVLQVAFPHNLWVKPIERFISWLAWLATVLWVTGLLPKILDELDQVHWKMGGSSMSLRTLLEGGLTASVVLVVSLWISAALESQLLKDVAGGELSVRKAISNALRAGLMFVSLMMALSSVGIDLTALSVLGGAIGVGIGFGLQKLAANYVSGFVILAERSMRIGDNVKVDNFEGVITNINARYTVIRSVGGRESIVPNEMLITQRVENLSLADTRVFISTIVSVSYQSDVELVTRLLSEAAMTSPRVLTDPEPSVALSAFGVDGLEFTIGFWIADPENGTLSLRSGINKAVLRSLREHHIEIPYPQRVLHIHPATATATVSATLVPDNAGAPAAPRSPVAADPASPPNTPAQAIATPSLSKESAV